MELINNIKKFALKAHAETNHYYDDYLPYEFHLRMVNKAINDFLHIIPEEWRGIVIAAGWLHDSIEDVRKSYNDVLKASGSKEVAEIVRAVTSDMRGRTREEKFSPQVYEDIRSTPYATFVKLCDRIANVQYSKMSGSSMFEKYKKEHIKFRKELYKEGEFGEVWVYLDDLFENRK